MTTGRTMTIPFQKVSDVNGMSTFRPVVPLRPMAGELGCSDLCLVNIGSPNTYLDWELAPQAKIDLSQAETVPDTQEWSIGGAAIERAWVADVSLVIPDGRYMIMLGVAPVIFVKPWLLRVATHGPPVHDVVADGYPCHVPEGGQRPLTSVAVASMTETAEWSATSWRVSSSGA